MAAAEGLKSGVVAAVRFRQIKKRLGWESDEAKSDEAKSDGASNSKGTSVLAAASPSKVTKATKGKAKALTPRSKKAIEALEQAVKAAANIDEDVEDSEDDGHALNTVIDELAAASDEMKSIEDSLFFE